MRPALVLGVLLATPACGPGSEAVPPAAAAQEVPPPPTAPPTAPPGTAFLVDEIPVTAAEVDRVAAWIELLQPEVLHRQARRLALAEVVLPRAAVAARHGEERARALAACSEAYGAPDLGRDTWRERLGDRWFEVEGPWTRIGGPDLWGFARELEEGRWSPPFERVGQFCLVRRVATLTEADDPRLEQLRLQVAAFPYLDGEDPLAEIQRCLDGTRLTIVDGAWHEIVPEEFQYRMQGGDPR